MKTLPLLLGVGLLGYYLYTKYATTTPIIPATGAGAGTPPTGGSTSPAFNSLAAIYQRLGADVTKNQGANAQLTPYQWNFYLGRSYAGSQPDTLPGIADWTQPITLNAYWSAASQWLAANAGLSGLMGWAV